MKPQIAVITPAARGHVSPLLPAKKAGVATHWEWYHRCLSAVGEVRYFALDEWDAVSGCDVVLVHEALELTCFDRTVKALSRLRTRNSKVVWVEPHQRTTFGAPVFHPGFFDAVDRVAKYQLMDYAALVDGLGQPENNLAPWPFHGHTSIASFYADRKLFAVPTAPETLSRHLTSDLSEHYGERILPLMRLFSLPRPDSWYNGPPTRQANILKEAQVGIALGDWPSSCVRGIVAGLLSQCGLNVKIHASPLRAAATSEAFVALGPVHLDGTAADALRFEALAVLPEDERYLIWDDVFVPYETYLPLAGFGELLRAGGRQVNGETARAISERLASDLADTALRARILEGQRQAHSRLIDPQFVAARLGVEAAAQPASAPAPARPRAVVRSEAPVRVGGISTDEISVVIQGALGRDDLAEQVVEAARAHLPGAEVVVSTWQGERELTVAVDQRIESADPGAPWQVHEEHPSNTGRLLVSTKAGLAAATRPYTLKLRSDTPLAGAGFLEAFQRYPRRGDALALLRDRMVVINYYCWNPASRVYGLFSVADTVNFGWTEDVREVWNRPMDDEPAISTWFETHRRPNPDECPWAVFRYTPEQLLWLGFLRKHIEVPFEHFCDAGPTSLLLAELSLANNAVIVDPSEFGVELPRFAGREPLEPDALYTHAMWHQMYERYCLNEANPALDAVLSELAPPGAPTDSPERMERLNALAAQARAQATAPNPLDGARRFVVLADAEDLLARDELLRAYADVMGGSDLVTLGIDASRLPAGTAADQVRALVDRCQLAERDDIDLLAVIGAQDELQRRRMLQSAHALYRSDAKPSDLPVYTPQSLPELRTLVETSAR